MHVCTEEKLLQCHCLSTLQECTDISLTGLGSMTGHAYTFIKCGTLAQWQLKIMLKWYYNYLSIYRFVSHICIRPSACAGAYRLDIDIVKHLHRNAML